MANIKNASVGSGVGIGVIDQGLRSHMNKVYSTMSAGMLVTALAAWAISGLATTTADNAVAKFSNGIYLTELGRLIYATPLQWVIIFAPLIVVFAMSAAVNRMRAHTLQTVFYGFSALMGLSLSSIFLVYTGVSIIQTFLVTAIAFAGLSLWGYTTKRDISGWGSFLMMGLIGIIAAMILNIFIGSSALNFAVSILGLLIFAGLTAYDTQKIKNLYLTMVQAGESNEMVEKSGIMGAVNLYLDFINLFIFLLQFLGDRR